MKRLIFSSIIIALFSLSSCNNELDTNCIEVRIIEDVCGNAILQVVQGKSDLKLNSWTNYDGEVFENVFGTFLDPCTVNYPENREDTFFVALSDSRERTDCIVCLALLSSMPEEFHYVRIVNPCELGIID